MSKVALKEKIKTVKGPDCNISGEVLPDETSLYDTHRPIPKRKNGNYTIDNTVLAIPTAHMREHGTLREREAAFETLKAMVNANNLKKMQKSFNSLKIQKIKTKLF